MSRMSLSRGCAASLPLRCVSPWGRAGCKCASGGAGRAAEGPVSGSCRQASVPASALCRQASVLCCAVRPRRHSVARRALLAQRLSSLISLPDEGEPPKGKGVVDDRLVMQERSDGGGILSRDDNGNGRRRGGACIGFVALVFMRSRALARPGARTLVVVRKLSKHRIEQAVDARRLSEHDARLHGFARRAPEHALRCTKLDNGQARRGFGE